MSRLSLILRYCAFAVVAVAANLLAQRLVFLGGSSGVWFILALGCGTLVGLMVKYVLDKRWIFYDRTTGTAAQGRQFGLYSLMGLATTAIFWISETSFWWIWGTEIARETGAVIGLAIGYATKYQLDRRFVFREASA